jgi:nicotinamidase-related amidase
MWGMTRCYSVSHRAGILARGFSHGLLEFRTNRTFIAEGTWGARIVDELTPLEPEHIVVKKGYGGFSNTPLDTILRNKGVTTCVVAGVTTGVCVSTTVRGGVEHNYRMILVPDAVAEGRRELSEAEIIILGRAFADLKTVDEVIALLAA